MAFAWRLGRTAASLAFGEDGSRPVLNLMRSRDQTNVAIDRASFDRALARSDPQLRRAAFHFVPTEPCKLLGAFNTSEVGPRVRRLYKLWNAATAPNDPKARAGAFVPFDVLVWALWHDPELQKLLVPVHVNTSGPVATLAPLHVAGGGGGGGDEAVVTALPDPA